MKDTDKLQIKPKLTGRPGMLIDLDGTEPCGPKKLTGVELLKERFTYFARLKTPEELEREREKKCVVHRLLLKYRVFNINITYLSLPKC